MTDANDPQRTAETVAAHMVACDSMIGALGITVEEVGPGTAALRMTVRADMVNGHGTAHGGAVFTLADAAFAYACNAYNRTAVAMNCSVTFVSAAQPSDVLTARAAETVLRGRNGTYDVTVTNQEGDTVALFRGHSLQVGGAVVGEPAGD